MTASKASSNLRDLQASIFDGDMIVPNDSRGAAFAKPTPEPGDPVVPRGTEHPRFIPLPPFAGTSLALPLDTVLPGSSDVSRMTGRLVFHALGDTGGVHGTETQVAIATAMQDQIRTASAGGRPQFFYHLGDIVYYNGQSRRYIEQFYEPYQYYDAPIFAIPGNHDGDTAVPLGDEPDAEPSLHGFMQNFCSEAPNQFFKHRTTMTQPYCYWKLEAPFVHVIGLYSNVDGQLDPPGTTRQQSWLVDQLRSIPQDKWVIVAVHHPCYSLDAAHGGYPEIVDALDRAFAIGNRVPDLVLSGHVHNYQRFSREFPGGAVPYIVAGAGGYANSARSLHKLQKDLVIGQLPFATLRPQVSLEAYDAANAGFLRLTAEPTRLVSDYFSVSFDDPPVVSAEPRDSITLDAGQVRKSA